MSANLRADPLDDSQLLGAGLAGDEQALERRQRARVQLRDPPQQPHDHPVGQLVVVDDGGEGDGDRGPVRPLLLPGVGAPPPGGGRPTRACSIPPTPSTGSPRRRCRASTFE